MSHGLHFALPELVQFSQTLASPDRADPAFDAKYTDLQRLRGGIKIMGSTINVGGGEVDLSLLAHLTEKKASDSVLPGVTPQEYFDLVQALVCKGVPLQKAAGVHGFDLPPLHIVTRNSAAGTETQNSIQLQSVLVFDPKAYTPDEAGDVHRMIFGSYGQFTSATGIIGSEFLQAAHKRQIELGFNVSGYGIWTMTPKNFERDYGYNEARGLYLVNPGTTRFCMDVDRSFTMPVNWGTFGVRANGTLAARTEQLPAIAEALSDIHAGKKTIEQALYERDAGGNLVARFDIYGMDPGFRSANYDPAPQPLAPDVAASIARFRSRFEATA